MTDTDLDPNLAADADDERRILTRLVRQKLEGLRRAGIDRIPIKALPGPRSPAAATAAPPPRRVAPVPESPVVIKPPTLPEAPAPKLTPAPARPVDRSTPVPVPAMPPVATSLFDEPELLQVVPAAERGPQLASLAIDVSGCTRCPHLAATRTQTVFGEGSPTARLMFVGEAPGADEDRTGRPFVGKSGALLTDMITKGMGLRREDVYIANVIKSRPPENRNPTPEEIGHCLPYLERQVAIIRPQFLCLLGKTAASALLETALPLARLRGKWHRYRGIPTIVTYHPSALLRYPEWKKPAWEDLQLLMNAMGIKPPDRKRSS